MSKLNVARDLEARFIQCGQAFDLIQRGQAMVAEGNKQLQAALTFASSDELERYKKYLARHQKNQQPEFPEPEVQG